MPTAPEHFDVLVVGAGVSGIDAGYRLQTECPQKSFAILEARAQLGGTWDLFRFPGIRSDSDMSTLGFPFRPWTGEESIADGTSILRYLRETAAELGIDRHIRFDQKVDRASWSTETSKWTVEVNVGDAAAPVVYTADFLYACSGYYSYESGYTPELPGMESFAGTVVHPQAWPEDLDYRDRNVVIIGSGATAVTMVPAMAERAAKVTMLQRSPSYLLSLPSRDPLLPRLRKHVSESVALRIVRWKNVLATVAFYQLSRRAPQLTRKLLAAGAAQLLPPDFPIDPHFTPSYDPWDQRMCIVPDGDLFAAVRSGRAEVVTDQIVTFTATGVRLASGTEIPADIVVTATGLNLKAVGGIAMTVDGVAVDLAARYAYRGYMLSGVPNFAFCIGYVNASWTLRADLSSRSVCKLLNHMDEHRYAKAVPTAVEVAAGARPLFDLAAGYVRRGGDQMPKQGTKAPWRFRQNYLLDALTARFGAMDEAMDFSPAPRPDSTPSRSVATVA